MSTLPPIDLRSGQGFALSGKEGMVLSRTILVALTFLVIGISGCGGSTRDDFAQLVKGKVLVKGEPASYAKVTLIPAEDPKSKTECAFGAADKEGFFALRPHGGKSKTKIKAGEYLVAVSWKIPNNPNSSDDPDYGKENLPAKFQDPEQSGLKVKIESATKELQPIEVTP